MNTFILHPSSFILPRLPLLILAVTTLALPSCVWDGHFTLLGYTTRPNYDTRIHTVYVPIFNNETYYRGLEFELTKAVIREIERRTPYKVISNRDAADTELTGTIKMFTKRLLNRNQLNEVREAETLLGVELFWRDLRTGELLSRTLRGSDGRPLPPPGSLPTPPLPPPGQALTDPLSTPTPPVAPLMPAAGNPDIGQPEELPPVLVMSSANFIPELGESMATAQQRNISRLAIQIVNMMEKPW